jgi:hypothetical protein
MQCAALVHKEWQPKTRKAKKAKSDVNESKASDELIHDGVAARVYAMRSRAS